MSKQLLSIDDFWKAIINDETKQITDWFVDMSWIDIWTEPWVAQINFRLEQDTSTSLSEDVLSFVTFDWTVLGWVTWKEIWKNTGTSWTLLHTNWNIWDNQDLATYQDYLLYASRTTLGRSTNTTIAGWFTDTPTWWSGTTFLNWWSDDLHFFKEFNNRLYISDWYALAELDWASDPTNPWNWIFTNNKFLLPVNEQIRSLEVIWWQLAIWTKAWNFYLWDWASVNASQIIKTSLWGISAMIQIENTLFVFAWIDGTVYRYNGADFIPVIQIPNFNILSNSIVRKPAVRKYKNGMIFCIPRNWIYVFNRVKEWESFSLNKYWPLSWGWEIKSTQWDVNAIYITNINTTNDLFIVWYRNSLVSWDYIDRVSLTKRYRIEELSSWNTSVAPYMETVVYELRDKNWKPNKVQWVQWLFKDADNRLQVEYRLNNTSNYAVLWTIWLTWIDIDKILRGIWKRTDKIQFRFKMWWNFISSTDNTKLISLKIF